ncbi:hypothetical protein TSOC_008592 [Tetrabaena socialis]|uniref:Uncharacterized protein n=1 Tax=Tetrabaena socialis TaxID=47790 RepID=A0A2J7ZY41_9CHLO|nr:hypothetical protein TSOC_008592 [Tetrabaena socialis]|eukprot:PNH05177.1 hypothetical protein TSOC_008592 [Tetrabaena socialis]
MALPSTALPLLPRAPAGAAAALVCVALGLLLLALLVVVCDPVQRWRLRRIPGPPALPLVGCLPQMMRWGGPTCYRRCAAKYGPVFKVAPRVPHAHAPFGYGSRMCIGWKFAAQEAKVALALLYQRLRFELEAGQVPLLAATALTLGPRDGVWLLARARNASSWLLMLLLSVHLLLLLLLLLVP